MVSWKVGRAAQKRRAAPKGRRIRPIRKGVGAFLVAEKKKRSKNPLLRQIGKTALKKAIDCALQLYKLGTSKIKNETARIRRCYKLIK